MTEPLEKTTLIEWRKRAVKKHRRIRRHSMPQNAKMGLSEIRAVWVFYGEGHSLRSIAEMIWERYGYSNAEACHQTLRTTFRTEGYVMRNHSEAQILKQSIRGCVACGANLNERTAGCDNCSARHEKRRAKGLPYVDTKCTGCGGSFDERTPGCVTCDKRHRQRKYDRAVAA